MNPDERVAQAVREKSRSAGPELATINLADVGDILREESDLRDGDRWGRWTYMSDYRVLSIDAYGPGATYEVHMEPCRDEWEAFRCVAHIAGKTWATDADVGALARALRCWLRWLP